MVSTFDGSYHQTFRRISYDSVEDQRLRRLTREKDEVLEVRMPPIPTPEQEVEYIDFLQEDFKSDPWLHYRFRKYMAGPKRIPWKNMRQLKKQYQHDFFLNWALGFALAWPAAIYLGRSAQTSYHGVPLVPIQWYKHDFINLSPTFHARKVFRSRTFGSALAIGWVFSWCLTDGSGWRADKLKNRPDMKPYPAMVAQDSDDVSYRTMREELYKKDKAGDIKQSTLYRYLFPNSANFEVKANPYRDVNYREVFNTKDSGYSTYTSDYQAH